ncbi:MAG: GvpL/GvpF family gas vesicle protein [Chloroflexi bacterium]|nr:GvpL/GvpF family gas vesicle protein [Chloroflexota bacterium]
MEIRPIIEKEGLYLYGIAAGWKSINLDLVGVDGSEVYTVAEKDLCVIVHRCPAAPYQSPDRKTVTRWVKDHQNVLDRAQEVFGTVIPAGFNTILLPKDGEDSPEQAAKHWLKDNSERFSLILKGIEGKDEYGVQVFYALPALEKQLSAHSRRIRELMEEMAAKSQGTAFLYKQRIKKEMKAEIETLAKDRFHEFYQRIKSHCEDIAVEKTRKAAPEEVMLLNLSCLVAKEKAVDLGEELEKINNTDGISVRFSGPWPPYSFVTKPVAMAQAEAEG